jgi:hypothetical protein
MLFARRNALPSLVKTNKAGGVSLLSFVRAFGLPDDAEWYVAYSRNDITQKAEIILTSVDNAPNSP